jgi:hypothetical protein
MCEKQSKLFSDEVEIELQLQEKARATKAKVVVEAWNKMATNCGLPTVRNITEKRKIKVGVRLNNQMWSECYQEGIDAIQKSPFLLGNGNTNWRANFNWFVNTDDNLFMILEGNYDKIRSSKEAKRNAGTFEYKPR